MQQRRRILAVVAGAVAIAGGVAIAGCGGSDSNGGAGDATLDASSAWPLGVATAQAAQQAIATAETRLADFSGLPRGGPSRAQGIADAVCDSGSSSSAPLDPGACADAGFAVEQARRLAFDECALGELVLNGSADYCVGEGGDATATFFTEPFNGIVNGICSEFVDYASFCRLDGEDASCSVSGDIVSGVVVYEVGGLEVTGDEGVGFTVTGSLRVSRLGRVDVTTVAPIFFADCPFGIPSAGELALAGARGSLGRVEFIGCEDYTVSFAADEQSAEVCSPALDWSEIYGGLDCPALPTAELPVGACP